MATLPAASVQIDNTSSAFAGQTGYCVVIACVAQSADYVPRVMSSTQGLIAQYGYAAGVDYCALHFLKTKKPVIFVGVPIATPGAVGSQNNSGVTGTSVVSVAAGTNGVMEKVSGVVTVLAGTNVGTDQILLSLSCDGGVTTQKVRLGPATSYSIPNLGLTLNFTAGTLNVNDVFTFQTTAPMWGSTAMSLARQALAGQQNLASSWMIVDEVPNATFAGYVVTEANNYATTNQRFVYARAQVPDMLPLPAMSRMSVRMSSSGAITFASAGHTITRTTGSFVTDGFAIGQMVTVGGSTSNNGAVGVLTGVSALVLTFGSGVVSEGPDATGVTISASDALTFAASGETITRSGTGSFLTDGFAVGNSVAISGTASNNQTANITAVTATVMTLSAGVVNEGPSASSGITIVSSQTMAAFVSATTSAFATIDAQQRVDLGFEAAYAPASPITAWMFRRPAAWAASIREYAHDVQIPCWRKQDGPLDGWSLINPTTGARVGYDENVDGGALAGRFTCFRSYSNGPIGAYIALSLTRDVEGSLLSRTHNTAVANLGETIVQAETENAIGLVLQLNGDGTGTDASLALIEQRVNTQLQNNLLKAFNEGPRASSAVWTASRSDILNTVGATLHGVLALNLNGTLEQINTRVRVQTGG